MDAQSYIRISDEELEMLRRAGVEDFRIERMKETRDRYDALEAGRGIAAAPAAMKGTIEMSATPNYWDMGDEDLAAAWRKTDGVDYTDDPTGEKIETLNFVEDAILQRLGAPDTASGDDPEWQEKIRAFGIVTTGFKVGDRVRLRHDVDRFPHFIAPAGGLGSVTHTPASDPSGTLCVKLDEHLVGAEDWDNEVVWSVGDGDDPARDLEKVV